MGKRQVADIGPIVSAAVRGEDRSSSMAKALPPMLEVDRAHVVEALQVVLDTLAGNAYRSVSASWSLTEDSRVDTVSLTYGMGESAAPD